MRPTSRTRPFAMACRLMWGVAISGSTAACNGSIAAIAEPLQGNEPRQLVLSDGPVVRLDYGEVFAPDTAVVFSVTAQDSTPHLEAFPTRLLVETDRNYRSEVLLVPYACLEPTNSGLDFPFNFDWLACDEVGINTNKVLSLAEIGEVERRVEGKLSLQRPFRTMPGGTYIFKTLVGPDAVATALRRIAGLRYVDQAYRPPHTPRCVLSDIVPPPPCPPWLLIRKMKFSHTDAPAGVLPVSVDGWIRITYTQSNGVVKSTQFHFPPQ